MNPFRAKRIADQFSSVGIFHVANKLSAVTVGYRGYQACFEEEAKLWAFLSHIAQAEHQEAIVAEAEEKLIA
jgi:hypothetical protein